MEDEELTWHHRAGGGWARSHEGGAGKDSGSQSNSKQAVDQY